jgi:NAD(P)H-flavin reductase
MTPRIARLRRRRRESPGVFTLDIALDDEEGGAIAFAPGQFNMLTVFGVGEAPISFSGDPGEPEHLLHTVRGVGAVSNALAELHPGAAIGLRGPFGVGWPIEEARGRDVVIVAGGIGLAPLRPLLYGLLAERECYGKIVLLYGTRSPDDILFRTELQRWRRRFDLEVEVTVDHAATDWRGHVGVVTKVIPRAQFDPLESTAFVCGPEVMMRFAIKALEDAGVGDNSIYLSMERNMKCAVGLCGHCQFGPTFICKDGPVFRYDRVRHLLALKEF